MPASVSFHHIGCDQTSSFAGKGKKSAWGAWQVYDDVSDVFEKLLDTPSLETLQEVLPLLERFIVIMYDRSSICTNLNEARKDLFARKGRSIEAIPSTADAFLQHAKRAVYQAAYCWAQCLSPRFDLPSPSQWGWHKQADEKWKHLDNVTAGISCLSRITEMWLQTGKWMSQQMQM